MPPDSLLLKGIRQTLACDFDGATAAFRKYAEEHPDDPAGPFYLAATLQSRMMDAESDDWEREFFAAIDRTIRMGESQIAAGSGNARLYFHLGSAYNYKGLYEAKRGGLTVGVLHAHRGVAYLEKAIDLDSTFYDACLGVGNYKYWSDRVVRYVRWLPWIRDERERGIAMVRKAAEHGVFSRWAGVSSLGWIEFDRKNFSRGLEHFQAGLVEFPGSRFFLWGEADCVFAMNDFVQAVDLYKKLLVSIRSSEGQNGYNEAECRFKIMRACEALGRWPEAAAQAKAVLALKPPPKVARRIERHRKAAAECLERFGTKK